MKKTNLTLPVAIGSIALLLPAMCFASGYGSSYDNGSSAAGGLIIGALLYVGLIVVVVVKICNISTYLHTIVEKYTKLDTSAKKISGKWNIDRIKADLFAGQTDYVKSRIVNHFCFRVEHDEKGACRRVTDDLLKESIRPHVEWIERQFAKMGESVPAYVSQMQTYADYYNFFTEDDFALEQKN